MKNFYDLSLPIAIRKSMVIKVTLLAAQIKIRPQGYKNCFHAQLN